jgi:hypothetical protein
LDLISGLYNQSKNGAEAATIPSGIQPTFEEIQKQASLAPMQGNFMQELESLRDDSMPLNSAQVDKKAKRMANTLQASRAPAVTAPDSSPSPAVSVPSIDPTIREKVLEDVRRKYGLDEKYSAQARKDLASQVQEDEKSIDWGAALSGLGAAIAGTDAGKATGDALTRANLRRQNLLANFDKEQKIATDALDTQFKLDTANEQLDPNSPQSKLAQSLASRMLGGKDFSQYSAAQIEKLLPSVTKLFEGEQNRLNRLALQQNRSQELQLKSLENQRSNLEKGQEKLEKLKTPMGFALTEQDAKDLKEGYVQKQKFDSQIQEMIDLRKKYGGEMFNRDAVARGKQLSKDLLLTYKNLAKLGVLSKADEDIINAIIPADPLEFTPASALTGQDPIMTQLESFKADSEKNFQANLKARLRDYQEPAAAASSKMGPQVDGQPMRTVQKRAYSKKENKTYFTMSDGSIVVEPGKVEVPSGKK